jgi:lauroyl/myristoyl acyltransferase
MERKPHNGFLRKIADILLPPPVWLLCRTLGLVTWYLLPERRAVALRNLALAFPERDERWRKRIAFRSVMQMFELFAVPLVNPWLSDDEIRRRYVFRDETIEILKRVRDGHPAMMMVPHFAASEALTIAGFFVPGVKFTNLYRPLDFKPAERYVHWARTRWGMKLVSRKTGLLGVSAVLSHGESVGLLFDQNTMTAGALVLSFGRICSATDLPGILQVRHNSEAYLVLARRTGFLRADVQLDPMVTDGTVATTTALSSYAMEIAMRGDDDLCAEWLWAHNRWKSELCEPHHCLSLSFKKNYLAESLRLHGLDTLPRHQPFIVRAPDDPERTKILAQWMPRLHAARPDVRWIVVAKAEVAGNFVPGTNCERLVVADKSNLRRILASLRTEWAEIYFALDPESDAVAERKACASRRVIAFGSGAERDKRGITIFNMDSALLAPDRYDELLAAVFKRCGLE